MQNAINIVYSDFSRRLNKPSDWWEYRLDIFKNYTLNSLANQTNKNFWFMLNLRDKFPKELMSKLDTILCNFSNSSGIPHFYTYPDDIDDLPKRARMHLPESEYIFLTRIDSDDLYHQDAIAEIQTHEYRHRGALVFQKGYCYDVENKRLQHYQMPSPPFCTILFPREVFIDVNKAREYMNIQGHDQVFGQMNSIALSENKFIVLIHGKNNRSQYFKNQFGRIEISELEHSKILKQFGL